MLPQQNRLKKSKDIKRVFERGKIFKENFLLLKIFPNNLERTRFAFVVSQKFSKKATLRNKIKRKLRELVSLKFKEIKKGIDAVIIVLPSLETRDFWEINKAIDKLFKKAKILQKVEKR